MDKKRVLVLIDGFNYYHKLKEYQDRYQKCVKWLDYSSLANSWLTEYKNDGIYVLGIEDALFVKRLQYLPGKIRVKSDNTMYESFEINPNIDNVKIIGNVVYTISKVACV